MPPRFSGHNRNPRNGETQMQQEGSWAEMMSWINDFILAFFKEFFQQQEPPPRFNREGGPDRPGFNHQGGPGGSGAGSDSAPNSGERDAPTALSAAFVMLGLDEKTATFDDAKAAYRKMAITWHPDKNLDDPEGAKAKFQEILAAYELVQKKLDPDNFGLEDSDEEEEQEEDDKSQKASQSKKKAGKKKGKRPNKKKKTPKRERTKKEEAEGREADRAYKEFQNRMRKEQHRFNQAAKEGEQRAGCFGAGNGFNFKDALNLDHCDHEIARLKKANSVLKKKLNDEIPTAEEEEEEAVVGPSDREADLICNLCFGQAEVPCRSEVYLCIKLDSVVLLQSFGFYAVMAMMQAIGLRQAGLSVWNHPWLLSQGTGSTTPLMVACYLGRVHIVHHLIRLLGDTWWIAVNEKNASGASMLSLVERRAREDEQLLEEYERLLLDVEETRRDDWDEAEKKRVRRLRAQVADFKARGERNAKLLDYVRMLDEQAKARAASEPRNRAAANFARQLAKGPSYKQVVIVFWTCVALWVIWPGS